MIKTHQYASVDSFYSRYIKRLIDILCAVLTISVFFWLYAIVALLVRINLGSPVIFKQPRPGRIDPKTGEEIIFTLFKFRTMTDARDENGNLLPDTVRLTRFGKILRSTSLDELPEVLNILVGHMSVIGPRPQLVRDMVFMTDEQRQRHLVRPGLSGLAQVSGRNALAWEVKLRIDLDYIERISFREDFKIVMKTIYKLFKRDSEVNEIELCDDFGDYLLKEKKITFEDYQEKQIQAEEILKNS